jgi:hypothetical protein
VSRSAPAAVWMGSGGSGAAPGRISPNMWVRSAPQNSRNGAAALRFSSRVSLSVSPSPLSLSLDPSWELDLASRDHAHEGGGARGARGRRSGGARGPRCSGPWLAELAPVVSGSSRPASELAELTTGGDAGWVHGVG